MVTLTSSSAVLPAILLTVCFALIALGVGANDDLSYISRLTNTLHAQAIPGHTAAFRRNIDRDDLRAECRRQSETHLATVATSIEQQQDDEQQHADDNQLQLHWLALEESDGPHKQMAVATNRSRSVSADIVRYSMAALADHLSGEFGKPPVQRTALLWVDSVVATPIGYSDVLAHSKRNAEPDEGPTTFRFRSDGALRPLELGVIHEARFVVLRCGHHTPETVLVRSLTVSATGDRGLLTLVVRSLDQSSVTHAQRQRIAVVEAKLDQNDACRNVGDGGEKKKTPGSLFLKRPVNALRVMSYNVWNFNGKWFKRCDEIARIVGEEAPDVAAFQEVRIDFEATVAALPPFCKSAFNSSAIADTAMHEKVTSEERYLQHSRMQSEHLMRRLRRTRTRNTMWFDYLPAMTYRPEMDVGPGGRPIPRCQSEGPMIATRDGLPLLGTFPVFLPRTDDSPDGHEPGDDHQRMMLCHAVVAVSEMRERVRVDVCTTHFSLSAGAQMLNARAAVAAMSELADTPLGPSMMKASHTLFVGDLNAEPDSDTIRWLLDANGGQLRDVYEVYAGMRMRGEAELGTDGMDEADDLGYTFNNLDDDLVKRIDFVLQRTWPRSTTQLRASGFRHRGRSRNTDGDAPSDHVALVADFLVTSER